jgi:RNA polymerase sigma factor (sigma-70 family)
MRSRVSIEGESVAAALIGYIMRTPCDNEPPPELVGPGRSPTPVNLLGGWGVEEQMIHTAGTFDERFLPLVTIAHRVAFRILGSRAEAEDVAQETLARAYLRWSTIEDHAEPWVARVAANQALKIWRRRERKPTREPSGPGVDTDALTLTRIGLAHALRTLPRRQREVLVLRYLADLTEEAVAAYLGCATGTVKQHAHRGLSKLRLLLAEEVNSASTP